MISVSLLWTASGCESNTTGTGEEADASKPNQKSSSEPSNGEPTSPQQSQPAH